MCVVGDVGRGSVCVRCGDGVVCVCMCEVWGWGGVCL